MDIVEEYVQRTERYALQMFDAFESKTKVWSTTDLKSALEGAEFVITAIEVECYQYWSQDFHVPRLFGSKQIYGENGGPESMFHTLRNMGPILEIAKTMETVCPNAWLINYTNPEAKLVEVISKLISIKVVGLCHGLDIGIGQLAEMLEMDKNDIAVEGGGLNHFGFFTKIWNKASADLDWYINFDWFSQSWGKDVATKYITEDTKVNITYLGEISGMDRWLFDRLILSGETVSS